jgi:hypothetical protein
MSHIYIVIVNIISSDLSCLMWYVGLKCCGCHFVVQHQAENICYETQ